MGLMRGRFRRESKSGAEISRVLDGGFRDLGDEIKGAPRVSLDPLTQVKPCADPQSNRRTINLKIGAIYIILIGGESLQERAHIGGQVGANPHHQGKQ